MTDSNAKGDRAERNLVNALDARGFAVMRAPASGSATDRDLPDVLAGDGEVFYAFEVKASSGDPIYVDEAEVRDLHHFAQAFGATAVLAADFPTEHGDPAWGEGRPGIYTLDPGALHRTDGGNYRIKRSTALDMGIGVDGL